MLSADKLSDEQLYAVWMNKKIKGMVRRVVGEEFLARGFSDEWVDKLAVEYEMKTVGVRQRKLMIVEKVAVLISPVLLVLSARGLVLMQVFAGCWYLWSGNMKGWKGYWKWVVIVYVVWVVVVMIVGKFLLAG